MRLLCRPNHSDVLPVAMPVWEARHVTITEATTGTDSLCVQGSRLQQCQFEVAAELSDTQLFGSDRRSGNRFVLRVADVCRSLVGLKNILDHATRRGVRGSLQRGHFGGRQAPTKGAEVVLGLCQALGSRYGDGALADAPIDRHLEHAHIALMRPPIRPLHLNLSLIVIYKD